GAMAFRADSIRAHGAHQPLLDLRARRIRACSPCAEGFERARATEERRAADASDRRRPGFDFVDEGTQGRLREPVEARGSRSSALVAETLVDDDWGLSRFGRDGRGQPGMTPPTPVSGPHLCQTVDGGAVHGATLPVGPV